MTAPVKHPLHWWLDQPALVAAVLSFAYIRDGKVDVLHDNAAQVYGEHVATIVDLAEQLDLIEKLDVYHPDVRRSYSAEGAEREADRQRADAVTTAQFVASLHTLAGAA